MSIISLKQSLYYGINQLNQVGIDSARLDSEILLGFVLGLSQEKMLSNQEYPISNIQYLKFKNLISKRSKHYPIAYLTGSKEFYGIDFYVNENVLVPRPETELLIEEVIKYFDPKNPKSPIILEIGTGSGCIALTLAKHLPKAKIVAVDISEKALIVARRNLRNIQYPISNIQFKNSNLLSNIKSLPDIIVANLPYLTSKELKEASIIKEPKLALYGGKDGLELYEKLLKQIKSNLIDNDYQLAVFLEINPAQKNGITKIIKSIFSDAKIDIKKDLSGKDRVVIIEI